ncbi:hypothetical protein [Xanthomonas indica]|uniref:Uncharacterized protein n=1 Tax=Xanthomonas indica TaxID=2912242 RepID=A0AAU8I8A5_9XANT|nr:hypothetical protein [Xanthomonas indica]
MAPITLPRNALEMEDGDEGVLPDRGRSAQRSVSAAGANWWL